MKKKLLFVFVLLSLLTVFFAACDAREQGSLKSITRPYIAQYECTEATLGTENLLEKFDYIKIILLNKNEMELVFKPKDGEKHTVKSEYSFDEKSHELTAEIGILGYKFKQSTVVQNGKFTITQPIGTKQLIMKFGAM